MTTPPVGAFAQGSTVRPVEHRIPLVVPSGTRRLHLSPPASPMVSQFFDQGPWHRRGELRRHRVLPGTLASREAVGSAASACSERRTGLGTGAWFVALDRPGIHSLDRVSGEHRRLRFRFKLPPDPGTPIDQHERQCAHSQERGESECRPRSSPTRDVGIDGSKGCPGRPTGPPAQRGHLRRRRPRLGPARRRRSSRAPGRTGALYFPPIPLRSPAAHDICHGRPVRIADKSRDRWHSVTTPLRNTFVA